MIGATYHPLGLAELELDFARRQILVADDDPMLVHMMKENLEQEGYSVSAAYDGQMALHIAQSAPFDLIILDVNMPFINGFKVFEQLRNSSDTAGIPVIFVTGEPSRDLYPVVTEARRVAHLKKPLDLESFNSLVRLFLHRYPKR